MSSKSLPVQEGDRVAYPALGLRDEELKGTVRNVVTTDLHGTEVYIDGEEGPCVRPIDAVEVL